MTDPLPMPKRPGPVGRWFLRAPAWLYRAHLGRLLGGRFLMLRHAGRRTGATYDTVLEVIGHRDDELFVISGFGPGSSWVRNIRAAPPVLVVSGTRRFVPSARFLETEEARALLVHYAARNPKAARMLGNRLYGGAFDASRLAAATVVVGLSPREDAPAS
jgi:deazaflavin-dependent oxidoreductase (nitroreductase family)